MRNLMLGLVTAGLAAASAPAAHNELTTAEIADGWIRLYDGETTYGWEVHGSGEWNSENGILLCEKGTGGWLGTTAEFGDFVLKLQYRVNKAYNSGIFFRADAKSLEPWADGYEMQINDQDQNYPTGSIYTLAKAEHPGGKLVTAGREWQDIEIRARGRHIRVKVNGTEVVHTHHDEHVRGVIGMQFHAPGTMKVEFRDIKLQPLGLASIFNGKNLDGWTVIPGHKSVYSVTPEGWLNVKDGNGQIETVGQWDDFVFQLDIISNGDHLNSGVFFRGEPGQFWNGYESQIRNEWITLVELKDGKKVRGTYTEKGDQVTVKIGRREQTYAKDQIKSIEHRRTSPVDFGTGGIYNRLKSRKVVSTDREWFSKTIIASGNHIGVWVNGYQTADFTDRRPVGDNARRQCRLEKGVISLQGHDPTTDLSFRNLEVAPLPEK